MNGNNNGQGLSSSSKKVVTLKLNKVVINSLFIFALFIVALLNFLSYRQVRNLAYANHWVNHTYAVIQSIDETLYSLSDIESDQRAYLITANPNFLNEVDATKNELKTSLNWLKELTKDNKEQDTRINKFERLIEERLALLNQVLYKKANHQFENAEGLGLFNHSNEVSDQAKATGGEIKSVELVLLKERGQALNREAKISTIFLIVGSIISLVLLTVPFILANIELINRKIIEHKNRNTQTHLRQIIESASDMIAALDHKNRFQFFNARYQTEFKRFFGKSLVPGMVAEEIFADISSSQNQYLELWQKSLNPDGVIRTLEFEGDDGPHVYELSSSLIQNENHEVKGLVHIIRDVTAKVREHQELQKSYEQLARGMEQLQNKNEQINLLVEMSDIMLAASSQEELSMVMAKYADQLLAIGSGYLYIMHPSKNYLQQASSWGKPSEQNPIFTPEQCWAIRLGRVHKVHHDSSQLVCHHIKDIETKDFASLLCVPLMAQNDIYGLLYIEITDTQSSREDIKLIITAFAELTALALANVRLRENLRYQSMRDPLTGLYNRRYLEDALFKQLHQAQRSNFSFAVLMLDLDHFKKINDTYGHDAGDAALKGVGEILSEVIRTGDTASRYGGEEFIIILHNISVEETKKRAEEIREGVLRLQIKYGAQHIGPVSISIGIAMYPTDAKEPDDLIEKADTALYYAKNNGRNQVAVYSEINLDPELKK